MFKNTHWIFFEVIRNRRIHSLCSFLLLTLFSSHQLFAESYRLTLEEKKSIENRKKIQQYYIEIECENYDLYHPNQPNIVGMSFYSDGNNMRYDVQYRRKTQIKGENDLYSTHTIWSKDKLFFYLSGSNEIGQQCAVDIRPRDEITNNASPLPLDVRTIGMNASGYMFSQEIETVVGCIDRENCLYSEEILDEILCKKFIYTNTKNGVKYTYWIAPSLGYNVICIHSYYDGNPRNSHQEVTLPMTNCTKTKVLEYKNSGLWFPVSMNYVCTSGNQVELKQDFKIKVLSLNERLDSDFFTLKSLNIPVGTAVMSMPESIEDNFFWDGYEIKSEWGTTLGHSENPKRYSLLRTILILLGLGLICAGCITKYIEIRKNKQ